CACPWPRPLAGLPGRPSAAPRSSLRCARTTGTSSSRGPQRPRRGAAAPSAPSRRGSASPSARSKGPGPTSSARWSAASSRRGLLSCLCFACRLIGSTRRLVRCFASSRACCYLPSWSSGGASRASRATPSPPSTVSPSIGPPSPTAGPVTARPAPLSWGSRSAASIRATTPPSYCPWATTCPRRRATSAGRGATSRRTATGATTAFDYLPFGQARPGAGRRLASWAPGGRGALCSRRSVPQRRPARAPPPPRPTRWIGCPQPGAAEGGSRGSPATAARFSSRSAAWSSSRGS
ncbi:unnamed protein product, partial [Prorocentrum cordatum]